MTNDGATNNSVALIKIVHGPWSEAGAPPMGILFVGNALKKVGYTVRVFHWTKAEALSGMEDVISFAPMLVGFSIITGDPADVILACCRRLKESLPLTPVVFGGVHPTLEPEQCLQEDCVDYVVLFEGEKTSVALADAIKAGNPVSDIAGLGYKAENGIRINPPREFQKNLDDFEMDWSLVDVERYIRPYAGLPRVLMGYVASRGCPHSCGFCYNAVFNHRRWRSQSSGKAVQDLNRLIEKHRLDGVLFYDDNFTANKRWAFEVLDGISVTGIHVETRIDYVNKEFLDGLAARGVDSLFLGVESGSDRLLKLIAKGFTVADTYRALELMKPYPFAPKLSFILGIPTETVSEYRATLRLIIWSMENLPRVGFTIGFYLPYPGTPLFQQCLERGFKKPERFEDWKVLDRWGGQPMAIPWTDGNYLTPYEVAELRRLISKMMELRRSRPAGWRIRYHACRLRFLYSGTPLARLMAWANYHARKQLAPVKRFIKRAAERGRRRAERAY
jgi:anaerobic magnesium-protoporphyrin IX monomethyl ester cyclase